MTGAGVTANNNSGIFVWQNGVLQLLVREGDVVDVDPGAGVDLATIINLTTYDDIAASISGYTGLDTGNNFGWLATMADGRTVTFITAVPEPFTMALLGLAGLGGGCYWLHHRRQRLQLLNTETTLDPETE